MNNLTSHEYALAGLTSGLYPHIVLMYNGREDDLWFVDLTKETHEPYRATKNGRDYSNVSFDAEYPISEKLKNEIELKLEFEYNFEKLAKSDCRKILAKNFVFSQEVGDFMNCMVRGSQHGIIHGPGGYGKSEMIEAILKEADLYKFSFCKSMGEGLSESSLYGGTNMKVLRDDGDFMFNLNKAFTNKEIVIFEELFDAPASVLLTLKNTITSGFVMNGFQQEPIRCRMIIGLTNRDPIDVGMDNSRKALIQRFPLSLHSVWKTHNSGNYLAFLELRYKTALTELVGSSNCKFYMQIYSEIMEKASKSGTPISPRVAGKGFDTVMSSIRNNSECDGHMHFQHLKFVSGLEGVKEDVGTKISEFASLDNSKTNIKRLEEECEKMSNFWVSLDLTKQMSNKEKKSIVEVLNSTEEIMRSCDVEYHDSHIRLYVALRDQLTARIKSIRDDLASILLNETNIDAKLKSFGLSRENIAQ